MTTSAMIQAAGVHDVEEALLLAEAGFTHIGFPLRLTFNREDVDEAGAAEIAAALREDGRAVPLVITYECSAAAIAALCETVGVGLVQLQGEVSIEAVQRLRRDAPGLSVIKSVVLQPGAPTMALRDAEAYAPHVDAFLTDTFDPATGSSGATGQTHDWSVSAEIVRRSPRPLMLAGGLNADNVAAAIEAVRPAGVDVHTGIEGPSGRKDAALARRFVETARSALGMG